MKIFGSGGLIDFNPPDPEELNSYAWNRLIELGIATEEYQLAMEENPEPGDEEAFRELAVDDAEYSSRHWWQKLDLF